MSDSTWHKLPALKLPMRSTHVGYVHGQINASNQRHPGVDLNYGSAQEDKGRIFIAPISLEIVHVDRQPYYGRTLVGVNHDLDIAFRFMHLSQILVDKGDWIEAESYLGRCGDDDGSTDHRYHRRMTAHLHHDLMRVSALKKHGLNYMSWNKALVTQDIFDEVFVDPRSLYPALSRLMKVPQCWTPKIKDGKYVTYLEP